MSHQSLNSTVVHPCAGPISTVSYHPEGMLLHTGGRDSDLNVSSLGDLDRLVGPLRYVSEDLMSNIARYDPTLMCGADFDGFVPSGGGSGVLLRAHTCTHTHKLFGLKFTHTMDTTNVERTNKLKQKEGKDRHTTRDSRGTRSARKSPKHARVRKV